jgi:hypothetical protein
MPAEELSEYGTAGGQDEPMRPQFATVGRDQGQVKQLSPGSDTVQGGANSGMVVRPGKLVVLAAPHCSTDRQTDTSMFFLQFSSVKQKCRSLSHFPNSNVLKWRND